LNFAPVVLSVPRSIEVRKVDLAVELQILSYHEQRRSTASALRPVSGGNVVGGSGGLGGTAATSRPASA
jgi:redox-sensing transcriptional repressor